MTLRLTAAQRAVITSTGHILVDAGAGSGKTTTVVQAICHQLGIPIPAAEGEHAMEPVSHALTLDQLAAVTFTNAAAADLKRKLRLALRAAGRQELAQDVDAARIGTIHGFCGDLMREHALRGGLRPAQRLLSEGEARVLIADCAREVLHEAVERADLPGLQSLLAGRRLKDIAGWVATAAEDAGRLERWHATRDAKELREHEQALLELALRATRRRLERLEDEGLTDFDHMLGAARDLLRRPEVRRAVQRRIRLLVIDEFQDVDPIQRDIAELLGGLAAPDSDPSRLVLVGDPKQSIYRFRRADVTLWNGIDARFRAGAGTVLPLKENFRSKSAILGFVDAAVGALLDTPVDEVAGAQPFEVRYAALVPNAPRREGDHAVELQVVLAAADGKAATASVVRDLDAAGTARRIGELHAGGAGYGYGEMAILLAGWGDVDRYETALRTAGIPLYVLRGDGFWDAREILDCLLALRAVRDAADHVAMVGFLKSPFVSLRDDTILALARVRGTGSYLATMRTVLREEAAPERASLERAVALLSRFGALRDRLPLAELLRRLLLETGYVAASALHDDGPQRCANLRKLLRLAADSPGRSLGEFLREVHEAREREEKVAPEPLYRERGDVVTITSIHGAKGLEWPVVFWCDLVREVRTETSRFCAGRETFALAAVDESGETGGSDSDPRHAALKSALTQEGLAEAYRLWYVAATRAKEILVLGGIPLGAPRGKATMPARKLVERLGALGADGEVAYAAVDGVTYHAVVRQLAAADAASLALPSIEPSLSLAPRSLRAPAGPARLSASQLMAFAHDPSQWRREYIERSPRSAVAAAAAQRAIVTGQVVHDVLERIGDDTLDVMTLIEEAIGEWDESAPGAESDVGAVLRGALRERVEAAVSSAAWRTVAGAPGARRELWFTRLLPDGTALTGALDLAAPGGGEEGARLIDVKTGAAKGVSAADRYAVQAAVYVEAVQAITGHDATFSLLSLPSGEVTAVPVVGAGTVVGGLVERIRSS